MSLRAFFGHWEQVREGLLATIDKFSEAELAHQAFEGAMPVGRIALHIADAEEGWFQYVVTRQRSGWPDEYVLENYPAKADIKALLAEVHERTLALLDQWDIDDLHKPLVPPWDQQPLSLGWIIWHVLEHEIHHRGELSLILGTLGREGLDV
jgi:uncharacterized damage-inducible protein DinB